MAQIDLHSIKKIEKARNLVHDKVPTTYTVFENDGNRFVQLDTYGKVGRELPEKASQSFQIARSTAKYLIELLSKEFNL